MVVNVVLATYNIANSLTISTFFLLQCSIYGVNGVKADLILTLENRLYALFKPTTVILLIRYTRKDRNKKSSCQNLNYILYNFCVGFKENRHRE